MCQCIIPESNWNCKYWPVVFPWHLPCYKVTHAKRANFYWRLIKCGCKESIVFVTDLFHVHQTSTQTSDLWETGSFLICCGDYNEDNFNCWWQITEPVEDLSVAAMPREQLEKQSSILFLLKSLLSLIKQKKKNTLMLHQNWFVIWSQTFKNADIFEKYRGFAPLYVKNGWELYKKPNTLQCHTCFHWSDSHAAFVMAKYAALTNRTELYPIRNRPSFLLPWPVVTFQH